MAECVETRTWEQIAIEMQQDTKFSTGTLVSEFLSPEEFEMWGCWKDHGCLTQVQHAAGDAMCYVYDEKNKKWIAWGLQSEVLTCEAK
jgi:hypothetical protein